MRLYLETSALVKLHVDEEGSVLVRRVVGRAELVATSALAYVEARAAFVRRRHEGGVSPSDYHRIVRDLEADWESYVIVDVTESVIRDGVRLAEAHRLRAYDAVHLASALTVRGDTESQMFVSWDARLERAAKHEGMESLPHDS